MLEERLQHGNSRPWYAGVIQPTDGSVEPPQAVPLIAEALRSQGVIIIENCAVRGIETSGGAVSSIVTEKGETRCQAVVLAGGAWSRLFLQNNGIDLPLLRVYSYQSCIPGFEGGPEGSGLGSGAVWLKDISGGYSLGTPVNTAPILPDNFRFFNQFSGTVSANWSNFKLDLSRDFLSDLFEEKSWSNGTSRRLRPIGSWLRFRTTTGVLQAWTSFAKRFRKLRAWRLSRNGVASSI